MSTSTAPLPIPGDVIDQHPRTRPTRSRLSNPARERAAAAMTAASIWSRADADVLVNRGAGDGRLLCSGAYARVDGVGS